MSTDATAASAAAGIVEPELAIIDPHHHLWDGKAGHHGGSGVYMLDELLSDLYAGHDVKATVYIECDSFYDVDAPKELAPAGEMEFANGIAALSRSGAYGPARVAASLVGHADLTLGTDVDRTLEALIAAGNGRVKGIRYITANDPDGKQLAPLGILGDERVGAAYARLAHYGLSFDAWLYHPQLPELYELAAANPEVPVVLNHAGGLVGAGSRAGRREESFREWRSNLEKLAQLPHAHIKLGGFYMPVFGFGLEEREFDHHDLADAAKPLIDVAIELFGPERCMFESNFPMTRYFIDYKTLWNAYKTAIQEYSPTDKRNLVHDTAQRFYSVEY